MAIAAAQQYESDEVVCPLFLRKNLFTTAAVDNLDHKPSSANAHDAFHGPGMSLFQNRVTESDGIMCPKSELQPGISRKEIPTLPESYTNLTNLTLRKKYVIICPVECTLTVNLSNLLWQAAAHRLVDEELQSVDDPIDCGLYFMLMHSNHATLMSPSHHCFHCFQMIPNMWPRFVTRWISCNVLSIVLILDKYLS